MRHTIDIENVRYTGQVSDPIADMLARIRNASNALHEELALPSSKMLVELSRLLKREGYIQDYRVEDGKYCKVLVIELRYTQDRKPVITGLKRISKPGQRQYANSSRLPKVLGGLGVAIMTTSRGMMTSKEAAGHHVGGEVVCHVW